MGGWFGFFGTGLGLYSRNEINSKLREMKNEFGDKIREYNRIIAQATDNANTATEKLKDAQGNRA